MPEVLKVPLRRIQYPCHWRHGRQKHGPAPCNVHSMTQTVKEMPHRGCPAMYKRSSSRAYDHGRNTPGQVRVSLSRVESQNSALRKPECVRVWNFRGWGAMEARARSLLCVYSSQQSKTRRMMADPECPV